MSNEEKGYYMRSFHAVLDYLYRNNIPAKFVYNDGSEQIVNIISYDKFNIICQDQDQEKSFAVFKHALKRIETEINLAGGSYWERSRKWLITLGVVIIPGLFNKKILNQRIKNYSIDNIEEKIDKIEKWQKNLANIQGLNEVELQNSFVNAIFENILGYEDAPYKDKRTLKSQATTDVDATRPDGIIGFYERTNEKKEEHRVVIELKGALFQKNQVNMENNFVGWK